MDQESLGPVAIGASLFDPRRGIVRRDGKEHRLEHRASRTLALLCARRGDVVGQDEIRRVVWNGRILSPNSIAIVIGDIRRALGDDARHPVFIETVAKRGYALRAETAAPAEHSAPASPPLPPRRAWALAAGAVLTLAVVAGAHSSSAPGPAAPVVLVEPVRNATGDPRYDPTAQALGELALARLARGGGLDVRASASAATAPAVIVRSKLILWDGHPTLSIGGFGAGGTLMWSGMASGPPFYAKASAVLDRLGETLRTTGARGVKPS